MVAGGGEFLHPWRRFVDCIRIGGGFVACMHCHGMQPCELQQLA